MPASSTIEIINDKEEYDNALDDGPNNPPCLEIATNFCELHNITCCTKNGYKHSHYQCKHNSDPTIAAYQECKFECKDIKQVEEYVTYVGTHELDSLINEKFDTSHEARVMKGHISIILQICINEFSDNAYVINYNKRKLADIEGTKVLEEEHVVQPKLGDAHASHRRIQQYTSKYAC